MKEKKSKASAKDKEETSLPPIFRLGSLSSNSTEDESVCDSKLEDPPETAETKVRLPVIDMSRTNSVVSYLSAPNSRGTRHSRETSRRRVLCKSPSCPSNMVGLSRQQSRDLESPTLTDKTLLNSSPHPDDKENDLKLPNIFRSANSLSMPNVPTQNFGIHSWQNGRDSMGGLRRTESCRETYVSSSPVIDSKIKNQQRSQTHAALLLPLRNNDTRRSVKGGNKRQSSKQTENKGLNDVQNSARSETKSGAHHGWEQEYGSDVYDSARGQNSFDRIMEENDNSSQLEIPASRNMKPWLKDRSTQKEGQVKA